MEHRHWLLPEGIDEVLPPKAQALERLRRSLLDLYRSWGYELVFPPFVEYLESLLTGTGGDLDLQTFKVTDQVTGRSLGVRADITPQVARIDAHQLGHEGPTRLCYLGTVLRTRNDDFAGSRSPLQIGTELYGHGGVEADLEILSLMLETLDRAGLSDVYLDLGHVGIFGGLAREAGLDKSQEIALFDVLQRKAVTELEALVSGFGLSKVQVEMFLALAELSGDDALDQAAVRLAAAGSGVHRAIDKLQRLSENLVRQRPDAVLHFDLGELRGYHYHTGVVFAAYVPGIGQEIARGGRYDDIGRLFGRARPAVGFSADLKQLLALGGGIGTPAEAAVFAPASDDEGLKDLVATLRAAGRTVVRGFPGQQGGADEMGCKEILVERDGEWNIEAV